jgi:hypothetical protein
MNKSNVWQTDRHEKKMRRDFLVKIFESEGKFNSLIADGSSASHLVNTENFNRFYGLI